MKNYKKLQNGSDIRGIAITGVPGELPNLTPDVAEDIARGFVVWLSDRSGKKPEDLTVAVGRDPRISGKRLVQGMMNGFRTLWCKGVRLRTRIDAGDVHDNGVSGVCMRCGHHGDCQPSAVQQERIQVFHG